MVVAVGGGRNASTLNALERDVLHATISRGSDPALRSRLEAQVAWARVMSRSWTGVGFFTHLTVPPQLRLVGAPRLILDENVYIESASLEAGACCLIFVTDGFLRTLEGASYGHDWNGPLSSYEVRHLTLQRR